MGDFADLLQNRKNKGKTISPQPSAGDFADLLQEARDKRLQATQQAEPKRSALGNVFYGLQQLQRPQAAVANAFDEAVTMAKADTARREAGGGLDPLLATKTALNIPGALWRGATAKTENLKDFSTVARNVGIDPYRNITDAWEDSKSGKNNPLIAAGKTLLNVPPLVAEVGANLILDPLNWVGVGEATKLGKLAFINKGADAAGEAITATSKIGKQIAQAKQAGKAVLPGASAREQALSGQKAALTFAGQPILPKNVSAAILGGVEDVSKRIADTPFGQGVTDLFTTTRNPELKLVQSKLRAGIHNADVTSKEAAIGDRENLKAMAKATGVSVDDLKGQLMEQVEALPGTPKGTLPVNVMADEYKAVKARQLAQREAAGLTPSYLGGDLEGQLTELKADYAFKLGQRGANIIKMADRRMSAIEKKLDNFEVAIKDETIRVGSAPGDSLLTPIGKINRQVAAREQKIKIAEHDLNSAMQLMGIPKLDKKGRPIVDLKDRSRVARISKEIDDIKLDIRELTNHRAQLEGVQKLIPQPASSARLGALIKARKSAYMDYFNEIGTMNKLLDKGDPAVIRQLEPKIAALEANLAASPSYAVHALTPEAADFVSLRKGTAIKVGGDTINLDNPSDIARTFTLDPANAQALDSLGFKNLQGIGKTTNDIRLAAKMKPLPNGAGVAVPGRSMTRAEVNVLAANGRLPGYEGVRFSLDKPKDLQPNEQWVKNEFFYSDPLIGRAIETNRTNKQLAYKKFLDEVGEKFGDPNGVDFKGIKVRADIAKDLNKYIITIEKPPNQLIEAIAKQHEVALNIWKTTATSANPGFHIRNFLSGVWANTALGDVHSVTPYIAAQGFVRANPATNKAVGAILSKIEAATGRVYSFEQLEKAARDRGILGSGVFGGDIKEIAPTMARDPNVFEKAAQGMKAAGHYVESTNRLALWLDQLTKGYSIDQATQTVHKLQFDYGDLTLFEQKLKKAVPFYAWIRKNIALQVESLLKQPGKYNTFSGKWLREIEKSSGSISEEEKELRPDYYGQFGFTRTPFKGTYGSPVYANPNLQFQDLRYLDPTKIGQNAMGALDPLTGAVLQLGFNRDFRGRELASYISSDQTFPFQGAHVPARGAGNFLAPFYGQGPIFAHPDRKETKVPPQLQYLLNRIPLAANLGEALMSRTASPGEERLFGDIDTGVASGFGGVKLTPFDIIQARKAKILKEKADRQAKMMQRKREGR